MTTSIIITVLIILCIAFISFAIGGDNSHSHFSEIRTFKAELKLKELESKHAYNLASLKGNQELKHRELENNREIKIVELERKMDVLKAHNIVLSKELADRLINEESIEFPPIQD